MGTFHAKYMVVDRRIAILNSNNIQVMLLLYLYGDICVHLHAEMGSLITVNVGSCKSRTDDPPRGRDRPILLRHGPPELGRTDEPTPADA
jgi:hypothetical protein